MDSVHVRVLYGERELTGVFQPTATVSDVVDRLFAAEIAAGKFVRVVHGGCVRPVDTPLSRLHPPSDGPLTLHAVVSSFRPEPDVSRDSSSQAAPAADSSSNGSTSYARVRHVRPRSVPSPPAPVRAALHNDDGLLDFGAVKISPSVFLTGFFGAVIICCWYMVALYPVFSSKSGVGLLIAFTAVYLIALSSQLRKLSRAHSRHASPDYLGYPPHAVAAAAAAATTPT